MQRMPAGSMPPRSSEGMNEDASPMLRLARRIRAEQGTEQVKAFLAAMIPFSAPNEIKRVGEGFGIPFESIEALRNSSGPTARQQETPKNNQNNMMNQLSQLKMLMQLSGLMKNGGDPSGLLNILNGR